ncbi:hypothetical protein, partial [Methanothrix sp.]|uniref:hypothetical protein n=1 Tax=Methanothrix sp. TaxID=90426 RepID=UPI002354DC94
LRTAARETIGRIGWHESLGFLPTTSRHILCGDLACWLQQKGRTLLYQSITSCFIQSSGLAADIGPQKDYDGSHSQMQANIAQDQTGCCSSKRCPR